MLKTPKFLIAFLLLVPLFSLTASGKKMVDEYDDYLPEEEARVARIKILDGDAQIKRIESEQWEQITENLPIVEGDELFTGKNSRLELQFDKNNYLHLAENSYLKIINLRENGIALSLSQGTLNLTTLSFEKDEEYFEIDAPQTTISVQEAGKYRIDAGDQFNKEVRVVIADRGEARVYSYDSGFTLHSGQIARLILEGVYAGQWQTSRNSRINDDFDEWTAERINEIEKNLQNAYYDKYYDDDIYGADDLNDYGRWIFTRDYGHVWQPYESAVNSYDNWSPYRYGQWRWIPYHGWTWVNDEPWGWATYHYGRWVYVNNYWAWSPYSYYRRNRSYWRPALVFITYVGSNICWYPLPYSYGYYDYNRDYRRRYRHDRRNDRRGNERENPTNNAPNVPSNQPKQPKINIARANRNQTPSLERVPRTGVVSVSATEFGRQRKGFNRPPLAVAETVLKQKPVADNNPPLLPEYENVRRRPAKEIFVPVERKPVVKPETKTGADSRTAGIPLDTKLKREKIYGNRTPRTQPRVSIPTMTPTEKTTTRRSTGVFDRSVPRTGYPSTDTDTKRTEPEKSVPRSTYPQTNTRRSVPANRPATPPPTRPETKRTPPVYNPPVRNNNRTERPSPPVARPQPRPTERKSSPPPPARTEPKKPSPPPPSRTQPKEKSQPPLSRSRTDSKDSKEN